MLFSTSPRQQQTETAPTYALVGFVAAIAIVERRALWLVGVVRWIVTRRRVMHRRTRSCLCIWIVDCRLNGNLWTRNRRRSLSIRIVDSRLDGILWTASRNVGRCHNWRSLGLGGMCSRPRVGRRRHRLYTCCRCRCCDDRTRSCRVRRDRWYWIRVVRSVV